MNRTETLQTAELLVTGTRAKEYGDAGTSFANIAALWTSYLNDITISSHDVAMMMILLKIVRAKASPDHEDSYVDIAGYAALGGEIGSV